MDASKLFQRKFAVPAGTSILAMVNDAAGLGFDFKVMVLVVAAGLFYSAIEAAVDIARIRAGVLPAPVVTGVTSAADPLTKS